ncbi:MAG: D-aminoacyl-tRNA deacylase [Bacteroidota bacterium]
MRAVIQRIEMATVETEGKVLSQVKQGLLILLGIEETDRDEDIDWLTGKIARLRVFDDDEGIMNLSVQDVKGEVMVISQFTLHASTKKGNRPSYIRAAKPEFAKDIYDKFIFRMGQHLQSPVKEGKFGAYMKINLVNDGPVTIIIDTKNKE